MLRRLLKWAVFTALAFVVFSALPVLALRWVDPPTSAFMLRAGQADYRWVDYDRISPHVAIAVVAAEDQQFPFHEGFDLKSIREAVKENAKRRRPRGASTISQQVAKNLFLWNGASYARKGLEAWFTVLIEVSWPKQRILEVYLNVAEFGRGVYGVEAASHRYWRKSAAKLNRYEAATLAAVLPSPRRMRADRPSRYVAERRDWILGQMRGLGGAAYLKQARNQDSATSSARRP
jgi:monofunctional glycosyltransferase